MAKTQREVSVQNASERALRHVPHIRLCGRVWTGQAAVLDVMGVSPSQAVRSIWSPFKVLMSLIAVT